MFCVFISPTAFADLFSREVANILKAFNLPTNRAQPPLRPTPVAFSFFVTAVASASCLSVQWLRGNEYPSWLLGIPRRGQAAAHQWEAGRRPQGYPDHGHCVWSPTEAQVYPRRADVWVWKFYFLASDITTTFTCQDPGIIWQILNYWKITYFPWWTQGRTP